MNKDSFYEHDEVEITKCGECWEKDIQKTALGEYTGIEAVHQGDLRLLNNDFPYQCDGCLKQNEAYENMDDD